MRLRLATTFLQRSWASWHCRSPAVCWHCTPRGASTAAWKRPTRRRCRASARKTLRSSCLSGTPWSRRIFSTGEIPFGGNDCSNCSSISGTGSPRSAAHLRFRKKSRPSYAAWKRRGPIFMRGSRKPWRIRDQGEAERAKALLLTEVNGRLSKEAHDLCEQFILANDRYVGAIVARADRRIRLTTWMVGISVVLDPRPERNAALVVLLPGNLPLTRHDGGRAILPRPPPRRRHAS